MNSIEMNENFKMDEQNGGNQVSLKFIPFFEKLSSVKNRGQWKLM
jgi:hypothetical protein